MYTEEFMNTITKRAMIMNALLLITAIFSYADDIPDANGLTFNKVMRRDWNLAQVVSGSTIILIDRTNAQMETYSIRFDTDRLGGRGASNIYFSSYTLGENNSISSGRIASTRMNPVFEMKDFREYEYFRHLERVYRWDIRDWKLELYTYDGNGDDVTLVFTPIYK
jgi:hypothetical protein